ncbi:MAG: S1/P1 nuclease [Pseudoxanthomonas sp.]
MPPLPRRLLLAAALLLAATPALAWSGRGHRMIAELALPDLTPATRAEVDRLLALEPGASFAGIAPWADELRRTDPDLGKRSAPWHYIDLADHDCSYDPPRDCADGDCLVAALQRQVAILADRGRPDGERLQALKFVVHLVGDAHQPLHVGHAGDKGGNAFQLNFDGRGSNLHSLWDGGLLDHTGQDERALLATLQALPRPQPAAGVAAQPPVLAWVQASCRIVLRPGFYPPRHSLDPAYYATWTPVAEAQLRLAGANLAATLNRALGQR